MEYQGMTDKVAARADLSTEDARSIMRATLQTFGELIGAVEADGLAGQLPRGLQGYLRNQPEYGQRPGASEFVVRVSERAGVEVATAHHGVRAVLMSLREACSVGRLDKVINQLPEEFRELGQIEGTRAGMPGPRP
jgi:uncharacterized protein (DUF2267 family)